MKKSFRRVRFIALCLAFALLLIGLMAPLVDGSRFSRPIKQALEASLGREVGIGAVHYSILTGPAFSLTDVLISEDPRFGFEPFAFVPTLEAHLRIDRLLRGEIRFSSLRLVDPSLNLVKRNDGTWNVVELVGRIGAPRRLPLYLFPSFEVTNGRIDLKFGTRKTILYMLESGLSIYPEHSGKLVVRFAGSPARTDRAGNGFGHIRGSASWYTAPAAGNSNRLEASILLDPSNLGELTTLLEGHDLGVHGTVSSQIHVEGPINNLRASGELRLNDVHRWDLLPASGEDWKFRFRAEANLLADQLFFQTLPSPNGEKTPVQLELKAANLLASPSWSVTTHLQDAPAENVIPIGRRLGLPFPEEMQLEGLLGGELSYSSMKGLGGSLAVRDATLSLPGVPTLHSAKVDATIANQTLHLLPAPIQPGTPENGTLQVRIDYGLSEQKVTTVLRAEHFAVNAFKSTIQSWFGSAPQLGAFREGELSGSLLYRQEGTGAGSYAGQFTFADSFVSPVGLAGVLGPASGRLSFDESGFTLDRLKANRKGTTIQASYRYRTTAQRPERLRLEIDSADLEQLEALLSPTLNPQTLLARLHVVKREVPDWLADRNMEGDLSIGSFFVAGTLTGRLAGHFVWQGTNLEFTNLQLVLPEGTIRGTGSLDLKSYAPRYQFNASVDRFPWRGGSIRAEGEFNSVGTGAESLQNLKATGSFEGQDLSLSAEDSFDSLSGLFQFSFDKGWPDLRLSNIQASEDDEIWQGEAASQSDGKLILDLQQPGRQRRIISSLTPEQSGTVTHSASVPSRALQQ